MSNQLLSIQAALQEFELNGYYRPASPVRHLAQLILEIQTGPQESNHLEICEIPVPDSELFLLQWYVQLPLPEPFGPDDPVPEFLQDDARQVCAALNQILPIGTFNLFEEKLCFRHIFVSEIITPSQIEYLVQTIESEIERCQPLLQDVSIGLVDAQAGIAQIDTLFMGPKEEPSQDVNDTWKELQPSTDSTDEEDLPMDEGLTFPDLESETADPFSIDMLSNATLKIDDSWDMDSDVYLFDEAEESSDE